MSVEDFIEEMECLIASYDAKLEEQVAVSPSEEIEESDDDDEDEELDPALHDAYNKLIQEHLKLLDENEILKMKLQEKKKSVFKW